MATTPFALDGRVAIVTGASSGLGRHFATTLHAAGATVVVAARREERLHELAQHLGERVEVRACDVADEAQASDLVDGAFATLGRIDILVNNAGIGLPGPAEDESTQEFRQVLDVNLVALFQLSQLVGRHMLERGGGSIVNVASILGLVASAPMHQASYCASKGAVLSLTRELAVQWAARGVRVNSLAPGFFRSEMTDELWDDERSYRYLERNTPMRRPGELAELDGALLLLASDAGSFITGQTIVVDGGWTAR